MSKELCCGEVQAVRAGFRSGTTSLLKHEQLWTLRSMGMLLGTCKQSCWPVFSANPAAFGWGVTFALKVTSAANLGDRYVTVFCLSVVMTTFST